MPRPRVALDEDEDYEDDYSYEAEWPTEEDDPQMETALASARAFLGRDFEDREIRDALWHYYYDVDKSVAWLRKTKPKSKPSSNTAQKPSAPQSKKGLATQSMEVMNAFVTFGFKRRRLATDLFQDCPWLEIPADRRGDFYSTSMPGRGGLLGGSSEAAPKKSKLAALAEARRKKENTKTTDSSSRSSLSMLDSLKPQSSNVVRDQKLPLRAPESLVKSTATSVSLKSPIDEAASSKSAGADARSTPSSGPLLQPAAPSNFAQTIFGQTTVNAPNAPSLRLFSASASPAQSHAKNPFAGPSPDDVVTAAQSRSSNFNASATKATTKGQKASAAADSVDTLVEHVASTGLKEPSRAKRKTIDVVAEYGKSSRKRTANFIVIGHVDAGKSTLMGRLLYDTKTVDQRTIDRYRREADAMGKSSFALAWVLDEGTDERAHGVTIDIAARQFETDSTKFTILDAPGHQDFVTNMIAGAAQADFAVLVLDASTGNFESGLRGQTKEHALLVRSLGLQRLVVAVNKLDAVGWSQERFDEITQQMSAFLAAAGFSASQITFVPCSGLEGDNIMTRSKSCPWYSGPVLLDVLEQVESAAQSRRLTDAFRLPLNEIVESIQHALSVAGRISSGTIQEGEDVVLVPSGETAFVKALEVDRAPRPWAVAGDNIILHLSAGERNKIRLNAGEVVCGPPTESEQSTSTSSSEIDNVKSNKSWLVPVRRVFQLKILAFEHVLPMFTDLVAGRLDVAARITQLVTLLDKNTGAAPSGSGTSTKSSKRPRIIKPGEIARIEIEILNTSASTGTGNHTSGSGSGSGSSADKSIGKSAAGGGTAARGTGRSEAGSSSDRNSGVPLENGAKVVLRAEGKTIATGVVEDGS